MTTFKNNAKYAELMMTYLDVAVREDNPLTVEEVLGTFAWRFKGGSLQEASNTTRLKPEVSGDSYPDAYSEDMAREWPEGKDCAALRKVLLRRRATQPVRSKGVMARIGSYLMLTSRYGMATQRPKVYSGMKSIYYLFARVWDWAGKYTSGDLLEGVLGYTRELSIGAAAASHVHVATVDANRKVYAGLLSDSPVAGLLAAVTHLKNLIRLMGAKEARSNAMNLGRRERDAWIEAGYSPYVDGEAYTLGASLGDDPVVCSATQLGPFSMRVSQRCCMVTVGTRRYAMSMSDVERLHQLTMSAASALVGVVAQAVAGTALQKMYAKKAIVVATRNIERIIKSSQLVALGEEVLVCKGYRRAYTAHLGYLAGGLCAKETVVLVEEAVGTAPVGVLDVEGFLEDAKTLDAAGSLNACKMFKICPAPDVSPGLAMIDRVKQIGNCNIASPEMMVEFEEELRTQILRAYIRRSHGRLKLRNNTVKPTWMSDYTAGNFDNVPSREIHTFLAWEGTAKMPDISPHDPANWKDSGLGADDRAEAESMANLGHRKNMITRLLFDSGCPMPGTKNLSDEHVIKFFVKAEGHKDPARGIFSANLTDRFAQSWMERAVDSVAREHPSYMIGQPVEVKEARVVQLTSRPKQNGYVAMYYSFDISGWSAKMPAEPQRISHKIWAELFDDELFRKATQINEGAFIYVNIDGYYGSYVNTASNLEGFNGKEMTMVLVAMLSLSVKRWRVKMVESGLMTKVVADSVSALLFAYIDDGLSRIDLPNYLAEEAFNIYKDTVIETFAGCGFSIEVSKCFPSDRFSIFLNEVYIAGRHIVHGVRAAMAISSEPTERHNSLIERVNSVATGCRGAVMAGLSPQAGVFLMAYHTYLHLIEWCNERDPVLLSAWSLCPRAWGGLGMPQMLQLFTSGSGSAYEEGVATLQSYARRNVAVKKIFLSMCRSALMLRDATGVLTAPLSGKPVEGYIVDSRVARAVRMSLQEKVDEGKVSTYAARLLQYSDPEAFAEYAEAVVPLGQKEVLQEQMLHNVAEAHPHSVFSAFARRLEKSSTLLNIIGVSAFTSILRENRAEAELSSIVFSRRLLYKGQ